jgi:hypothetical protein
VNDFYELRRILSLIMVNKVIELFSGLQGPPHLFLSNRQTKIKSLDFVFFAFHHTKIPKPRGIREVINHPTKIIHVIQRYWRHIHWITLGVGHPNIEESTLVFRRGGVCTLVHNIINKLGRDKDSESPCQIIVRVA